MQFRYTETAAGDGARPIEFGLIAEEVVDVFPELVVYDNERRPFSVRYHLLAPLLLHELQRQQRELERQRELLERLLGRSQTPSSAPCPRTTTD